MQNVCKKYRVMLAFKLIKENNFVPVWKSAKHIFDFILNFVRVGY